LVRTNKPFVGAESSAGLRNIKSGETPMNELTFTEKLTAFAFLLEYEQLEGLKLDGVDCEANRENKKTKITMGNTWARVDVGNSGKYMVALKDNPAKNVKVGDIVFIKAYGVPNLLPKHRHGTLDTIDEYCWQNYEAGRLVPNHTEAARSI
jgi:hypothetical protein